LGLDCPACIVGATHNSSETGRASSLPTHRAQARHAARGPLSLVLVPAHASYFSPSAQFQYATRALTLEELAMCPVRPFRQLRCVYLFPHRCHLATPNPTARPAEASRHSEMTCHSSHHWFQDGHCAGLPIATVSCCCTRAWGGTHTRSPPG